MLAQEGCPFLSLSLMHYQIADCGAGHICGHGQFWPGSGGSIRSCWDPPAQCKSRWTFGECRGCEV